MADFGSRVLGSEQLERLSKGITKSFGIVTGGAVTVNAGLVLNVAAVAANDYVINGAVQANAYAGGDARSAGDRGHAAGTGGSDRGGERHGDRVGRHHRSAPDH